jgi:hypothetical protein
MGGGFEFSDEDICKLLSITDTRFLSPDFFDIAREQFQKTPLPRNINEHSIRELSLRVLHLLSCSNGTEWQPESLLESCLKQLLGLRNPACDHETQVLMAIEAAKNKSWYEEKAIKEWHPGMRPGSGWILYLRISTLGKALLERIWNTPAPPAATVATARETPPEPPAATVQATPHVPTEADAPAATMGESNILTPTTSHARAAESVVFLPQQSADVPAPKMTETPVKHTEPHRKKPWFYHGMPEAFKSLAGKLEECGGTEEAVKLTEHFHGTAPSKIKANNNTKQASKDWWKKWIDDSVPAVYTLRTTPYIEDTAKKRQRNDTETAKKK